MMNKANKNVFYVNAGSLDYQGAWDLQEHIFGGIVAQKLANKELEETKRTSTNNYLIFCEHPHVYTLGKSGKPENLLIDQAGLAEKEASFYKINRGGDITYHGPGQLVVYPIFDLDNFFTDIHKYLRFLEESVIQTLAHFDIKATRINGLTGVWINENTNRNIGERKICAMGVKASRWVTMHGLALNVNTDLSYFGNIVPCGIDDKAVTSMQQERGFSFEINKVAEVLRNKMLDIFEIDNLNEIKLSEIYPRK